MTRKAITTHLSYHLPFFPLFLPPLLLLSLLSSCKTAQQIRREKQQNTINVQVQHLHKQSSGQAQQIQEYQKLLNRLQGRIEEFQHRAGQKTELKEKELAKSLAELNTRLQVMEKKVLALERHSRRQGKFIQNVTKQLKVLLKKSLNRPKANKSSKKSPGRKSSKPPKNNYHQAMALFKQRKNRPAKDLLLQVLGQKKLPASHWAYAHHALGIIHYRQQKYRQAMVHFSKVYTKYPKSSKAPNCLLHIAKSFLATGEKEAAKGSLEQLLNQYPQAKGTLAEAKKLLQGL